MIKARDPVTAVTITAPAKVTRDTPVTVVTECVGVTHCFACGQRLPVQTKAATKQKAYRQRKKARQ